MEWTIDRRQFVPKQPFREACPLALAPHFMGGGWRSDHLPFDAPSAECTLVERRERLEAEVHFLVAQQALDEGDLAVVV